MILTSSAQPVAGAVKRVRSQTDPDDVRTGEREVSALLRQRVLNTYVE